MEAVLWELLVVLLPTNRKTSGPEICCFCLHQVEIVTKGTKKGNSLLRELTILKMPVLIQGLRFSSGTLACG